MVESGYYKNLFVHRVATRGGIWGFFCNACRMCHLIATATRERATPLVRGTVGSVVVCRVFDSGVDGRAERTGDGGTEYPHRYVPPTSACPPCLPTTARRGCSPGRPPRLFRERGDLTLSRSSNACTPPATGLGGGTPSNDLRTTPPRGCRSDHGRHLDASHSSPTPRGRLLLPPFSPLYTLHCTLLHTDYTNIQ